MARFNCTDAHHALAQSAHVLGRAYYGSTATQPSRLAVARRTVRAAQAARRTPAVRHAYTVAAFVLGVVAPLLAPVAVVAGVPSLYAALVAGICAAGALALAARA